MCKLFGNQTLTLILCNFVKPCLKHSILLFQKNSKRLEAESQKYEKEKEELQNRLSILSEANNGQDNDKLVSRIIKFHF